MSERPQTASFDRDKQPVDISKQLKEMAAALESKKFDAKLRDHVMAAESDPRYLKLDRTLPSKLQDAKACWEALKPLTKETKPGAPFLNNFWQLFFREERLGFMGETIAKKPWRQAVEKVAGEVLEPIRAACEKLGLTSQITAKNIPELEGKAGGRLEDLQKAVYMLLQLAVVSVKPEDAAGETKSAYEVVCR